MREFSVLIRPAPDVEGEWVAHCLNWDVVSQGTSPSHATRMVAEALVLAIEEDLEEDLDPADRNPAPPDLWETFQRTQQRGTRIAPADIDKLGEQATVVIAAILYLKAAGDHASLEYPLNAPVPPPFMIAAMQGENSTSHRPR